MNELIRDSFHLASDAALADWSDMALFLAVMDGGSLVAAADTLGLSQPTVGRRLTALEERLGVTLFARTGRRMVPTEVAGLIEESARKMAREMSSIRRNIAGHADGLSGQVTVSAIDGTGSEWLVPVLADLHERYPDIFVELKIESRAADLVQREADIALRMVRPTQLDLITRKLATVGFGIYASKNYLKSRSAITAIEHLREQAWVRGIFRRGGTDLMQGFLDEHEIECRVVLSTNSPTAQLRAERAGIGIGVLSHRWASQQRDLQRVLPKVTPATIDLWLVTHEDLRYSARIRAVADHIVAAATRDAALFAKGSV